MSQITNVLLLVGHAPDEALTPYLEAIEGWEYREIKPFPLAPFSSDRLPIRWHGGDAELGAAIALGALNHLPLEAYLVMLRSLPWEDLGRQVQLAVNEQEDEGFTLHPIHPVPRVPPDATREQALVDIGRALPKPKPDGLWPRSPDPADLDLDALDDAVVRYLASRGYRAPP